MGSGVTGMERYKLYGGGGSPYSMKMRAILRYRRIPHDWVLISRETRDELKHDGPPVIPVLRLPEDGSLHVDSTPLAWMLEERHTERSLFPDDPNVAYLSDLIEDMGDEWVTKMMFHYRWFREEDQRYSSRKIVSDNSPGLRGETMIEAARALTARQVGRMPLVGCTPENAPLIEAGYHELLDILDTFVTRDQFVFGTRPSIGDFGLFGQLQVLASDHTPMLIMRSRNPSVFDWVRRLEDASGIEGEWHDFASLRPAVHALLEFTGRYYLPFLAANAAAYAEGAETFTVELAGQPFSQAPFKYQVKCYDRLRKRLASSGGGPLLDVLDATGCLPYLQ